MRRTETELKFKLTLEVDRETGEVLAAYLLIREGTSARVREFAEGSIIADYDNKGELLGIELLGPFDVGVVDRIARREPKRVRNFLLQSVPRAFQVANV
jgi:Protein of unknown function (DUF2283)